jgi:hypothetical protein
MVSPNVVKKIPIAIGIKPEQPAVFKNKTLDFANNTGNLISNVPTAALQYNTITINGTAIPLGGSIALQVAGGSAIVDTDTTYTFTSSTIANGARLDLEAGGSGVGTQSIEITGGGNLTVSREPSGAISITDAGSLGGVSITDSSVSVLTNKEIDGTTNTLTNISNTALSNSYITINGNDIPLGGTVTIQGGGGGGGDVTADGITTFTNKTISGTNNSLIDIPNSALSNNAISINGTPVELGTNFNVSGLGDVTLTGQQTLTNKGLISPVIQDISLLGVLNVGQGVGANPGQNNQLLQSTGTGLTWTNQSSVTAGAFAGVLTLGAGLSTSTGITDFDGSNGVTISVDTTTIANLTGTQTLSNKTLSAPDLTGDLKIDGVSGGVNQVIVSDGSGGLAWGSGGSGGGGSFNGPASSTNDAIVRYDGTGGTTAQNSLVTIDDTGIISAPSVASIIPFYHSSSLSLPAAATVNGAVVVTSNNNSVYYASNGNWTRLATESQASIQSRQTFQSISTSIDGNTNAFPTITNAYKSWLLYKVETDRAAWVTIYTSTAARTTDASRTIDQDPLPGSGVIAEVITTGNQSQTMTPAVIGFNDEPTVTDSIYMKVRNRSGSTSAVTVTLTLLKLEA